MDVITSGAALDAGGRLFSSGKYAAERLLRALKEGRKIDPSELRTLDTLRHEEWKNFDTAIVGEALIRLVGVADLIALGLTKPVPNSMGKTLHQYDKDTEMSDATLSLDGIVRSENDRTEYAASAIPLPISHKDFFVNLRTLAASREKGEPLDVAQARKAGRKIAELQEDLLFNGSTKVFGGYPIYGLATHPNINTSSFGTNGNWAAAAKTGENILADVLTNIQALENDRMFGPYWIWVDRLASTKLANDFKANSDKTILQRILEVPGVKGLSVADKAPANKVLTVQVTSDVVEILQGEPLQAVQWDAEGGFLVNFKGFMIQVPLVKADSQGRSGIVLMA